MPAPIFKLRCLRARGFYECVLCQSSIDAGQYYYRDDPPPAAKQRGASVRYFCVDCVDNGHLDEQIQLEGDSLRRRDFTQPVVVSWIDINPVVSRLLLNPDDLLKISPDDLENFVCDRLVAMGYEARRIGLVNESDGGIDIVFWNTRGFPFLGAVQVKHHRHERTKTGPKDVRDFAGALQNQPFHLGLVVTNTTFTPMAKWYADNQNGFLRLKDGPDLRKWIQDDFTDIEVWSPFPNKIVLGPNIEIDIPRVWVPPQ